MKHSIKKDLHQLIDNCNDESLLKEAKLLLQEHDWWDDLSEKEQNDLKESEAQYGRGEYVTLEELLASVDLKKWQ
jgi:hypothetical protein